MLDAARAIGTRLSRPQFLAGKRRDEQAFTTCVGIVTMPTLLLSLPHVPTNADHQRQRIAVTCGNSHSFHTCGSQPEPCGDSTKPRPFLRH